MNVSESTIDPVVFGDNQFFGINHMSTEKARQQARQFRELKAILACYDHAMAAGVHAFMLNTNDAAAGVCSHFRGSKTLAAETIWYPSIPYPHKYANLVAEKGLVGAVTDTVLGTGAGGFMSSMAKASAALLWKNEFRLMEALIDIELSMFAGLQVKAIFLQNIVTDMLLGLGAVDVLGHYCEYIRKRYSAWPGLITQNLVATLQALREAGIRGVVVCASFNKAGYLMAPGREEYEAAASQNNSKDYPLMAMATMASGAVPAGEAIQYIRRQNIQSVVFGASSQRNITQTVQTLRQPVVASQDSA